MTDYKEKYLKYKNKYLELKSKLDAQKGGNYYAKGTYALFLNDLQADPNTSTGQTINSNIIKNFDKFTNELGSCALFLRIGSTLTGFDLTHSYDTIYANRSATKIVGSNVKQAAQATYDVSKEAATKAYDVSKEAATKAYDVGSQAATRAYDVGSQAATRAYDVSKEAASKAYGVGSQVFGTIYDTGRNMYGKLTNGPAEPSQFVSPVPFQTVGSAGPGSPNGLGGPGAPAGPPGPVIPVSQGEMISSDPGANVQNGGDLSQGRPTMKVEYTCDYKPMRISDLSESNTKNYAYVSSLNKDEIQKLVSRINNNVDRPIATILIVQKLGNTTNDAEINKRYDVKYSNNVISEVVEYQY